MVKAGCKSNLICLILKSLHWILPFLLPHYPSLLPLFSFYLFLYPFGQPSHFPTPCPFLSPFCVCVSAFVETWLESGMKDHPGIRLFQGSSGNCAFSTFL